MEAEKAIHSSSRRSGTQWIKVADGPASTRAGLRGSHGRSRARSARPRRAQHQRPQRVHHPGRHGAGVLHLRALL